MIYVISRVPFARKEKPTAKPPIYRGHLSFDGFHAVCGSGKDMGSWQIVTGAVESVTCLSCLKRAVAYLKRKCKRCGCDHAHACVGDDGRPCFWVKPDLCSDCETPKERRARINGK